MSSSPPLLLLQVLLLGLLPLLASKKDDVGEADEVASLADQKPEDLRGSQSGVDKWDGTASDGLENDEMVAERILVSATGWLLG